MVLGESKHTYIQQKLYVEFNGPLQENLEHRETKGNLEGRRTTHRVAAGFKLKYSLRNWALGHLYNILAKSILNFTHILRA